MKKGLWLNRGLSFRFGHQFMYEVGRSWTVPVQKKAFESQLKLIDHIEKNHNVKIDIIIDTLSTQYNNIVEKFFKKTAVEIYLLDKMDPGHPHAFNRALYRIVDRLKDYDFLIISRNDMIFKDKMCEIVDPNLEEIKYPFVLPYSYRKLTCRFPDIDESIPMAGDTFFFFPKKYFHVLDCFKYSKGDNHDFIKNALDIDSNAKITPYLNTYHDSDPKKDWNPLYKFVGRIDTDNWVTGPDLKYPDDY